VALTKYNYNSFDLTTAASKGLAFNSNANGFETSSAGSMTLIKTLTASNSANLSFVHGSSSVVLDNTYPVYLFKFINIHTASDNQKLQFNMSTDSGSNYNVAKTTTCVQHYHYENDVEAVFAYDTGDDAAQATGNITLTAAGIGSDNDESLSGEMYLFNPSSTAFVKHFLITVNVHINALSLQTIMGGHGNTSSAIDAIKFLPASGNIDSGTIKLYGIKDS
jgi:hypothetical protein